MKMQFGASQVTRERETKALISLGDDLKAAATDALKKCATFLGVGLHLYADKPIGRDRRGRHAPGSAGGASRPADRRRTGTARAGPRPSASPHPTPGRPGGGATPAGPAIPAAREAVTVDAVPRRRTPRQLDAIWRVAHAKGLDPGAVEDMSLRVFNRKPDALTPARRRP